MPHGAQGVLAVAASDGVGVHFFGIVVTVLSGQAADAVEQRSSGFATVIGYGEGQGHVFLIRGGDVRSRTLDSVNELFQTLNRIVHFF